MSSRLKCIGLTGSVLAAWLFTCLGAGVEYAVYCDSSNTGAGDGTIANPWSSLAQIPWPMLQSLASQGTNISVNLKRGSEWQEKLVIGGSGTTAHPITIQAYGEGAKPTIQGGQHLTNWNSYPSTEGLVWSWDNPLAASVTAVFQDGELLKKATDVTTLQDEQWCLQGNALLCRQDQGSPDTNSWILLGLIRDRAIECRQRHDIRIQDVRVVGASSAAGYFYLSTNVSVLRCPFEQSFQNLQIQGCSNVTFMACHFGHTAGRGIYITGSGVVADFLFCLMSPGQFGGPSVGIDSSGSTLNFINCTMIGSRSRHISNVGSNIIALANCIFSVPACSDESQTGEEIKSTAGSVTARNCLIQPNGQAPSLLAQGVDVGDGCIYSSPGFVRNASRGFLCLGLDDSGSFSAFTNLARLANQRGLKIYLSLDGVQDWSPMVGPLQAAILEGHDILCHTTSHSLLAESNAITLEYNGPAPSATVSVSGGVMALTVDGTNFMNVPLAKSGPYYNISRLASYLNGLADFTSSIVSGLEAGVPSEYLENVSNLDITSQAILQWDVPVKWTNEVQSLRARIQSTFTNRSGEPYDTGLIAYPSGSYNEPLILKLQEFGLSGGRTTLYAGLRLKQFDRFKINASPVFKGRGAQLDFDGDLQDQGGTNHFASVNVTFSLDSYEGTQSGVFNGMDAYATRELNGTWDFHLGDWHVAVAVLTLGSTNVQTVFYQGTDSANSMTVALTPPGGVRISVKSNGVETLRLETPPGLVTADGSWHKIKAREIGDRWQLFVDGALQAAVESPARCGTYVGNVLIGAELDGVGSPCHFFKGQMDSFSQSRSTYMNTQALLDAAAEAGFVYMDYTHGYINSPETMETVLDAAAEYPGGSAAAMSPSAALGHILADSRIISNRWITLTNLPGPDYRLSARSAARDKGSSSVLIGRPNLEDLAGVQVTGPDGTLVPALPMISMGAYQTPLSVQIAASNGRLILSWPAASDLWTLCSSTNLLQPKWQAVSQVPVQQGSQWVLEISPTQSQVFYQLRAP